MGKLYENKYRSVSYQVGKYLHKLTFTTLGRNTIVRIRHGAVNLVGPYR
jgi:hypothetical protein